MITKTYLIYSLFEVICTLMKICLGGQSKHTCTHTHGPYGHALNKTSIHPSIHPSGQVRSECLTCTFRESCCSERLSRAQVPTFADSSVRDMNPSSFHPSIHPSIPLYFSFQPLYGFAFRVCVYSARLVIRLHPLMDVFRNKTRLDILRFINSK